MKRCCHLLSLLVLGSAILCAGTTGKISGRITDKANGEPLAGANILVTGTLLGASADADGAYFVINVSPGTYDLRATFVGYAATTVKSVRVIADQTTIINFQMEAAAVELGDVVVQAERPMVQRDMTSTSYVVSSTQIKMLPVKDFVEVVQMQAGVVSDGRNLYIRGGRSNEVAYMIDGMYVKDPVLGGLGTNINNDAIEELNFLSGTFNAEYGNALSGVVNIVTKEGGADYHANIEARTSQFGVTPYKNFLENRVDATVSGPIPGAGVTFFGTGERDARGSWLPFGYDRTLSTLVKGSARILPELKAVMTGRYSEEKQQPYNHSWKYIPDQYLRVNQYSRQVSLALTHTITPSLFYEARFSYFNQSYYSGVNKDTSQYNPLGSEGYFPQYGTGFEFYSLADPIELTENWTKTWDAKGDLVWQLGKSNEVKGGFEFKKHNLEYFDVYDPKRDHPYVTHFQKNPVEGAAYVQDKIELNALVMNLGLRFDYANQLAEFRTNPLDSTSLVSSKAKLQLSPRIGVAHPISDRTTLHFSYGHFFQNPDYERLYENSQYDVRVREPLFGQPNLDAERTTAYEVGISHQFSPAIAGAFTAFYKDVTGLVGTQYFPPYVDGRYVGYTLYMNEAYANIKGFEVRIDMRRIHNLAGSLTYTYSVAKGSASSEQEDYPGTTESTLLYPLNFDKPHSLNVNANLSLPGLSGPEILGSFPFENTIWNLVVRAGSGFPYTPTPNGRSVTYIEKNSARMPMTYSIDLEINKEWMISSTVFTIFVEILNLTDHKNVLYVYTDTGSPDISYVGNHSAEYLRDPSNYGPPRRIRLGARFRF